MAGLAAAMELTNTEEGRREHEVTVYQSGWLLGGKGASIRNRAEHFRIEEHGLHLWMGCYHNAFGLLRRVYEELERPASAPLARWSDAFEPQHFVVLEESLAPGWRHWRFEAPSNRGVPGLDPQGRTRATDLVTMAFEWLVQILVHWTHTDPGGYSSRAELARQALTDLRLVRGALAAGSTAAVMVFRRALSLLAPDESRLTEPDVDLNARWAWFAIDFVATHVVGLVRDGLLGEDADLTPIEGEEYRAWLLRHGASAATVDAPPVRSLYTLAFSHDDGIAASVAIPVMLRMMLDYRGALLYRLTAGMGEVVFAPLYEVLRRRGVRFELFHQLLDIEVAPQGCRVERLRFAVQATARGQYDPLIDVDGLPCWPEAPLWEQLVEGESIAGDVAGWSYPDGPRVAERDLLLHRDFDDVVVAIPSSALRSVAGDLARHEPRWRTMLERSRSIATHAVQLWLSESARELGWRMPPAVLGTYARPLDTWCDMTHLVARERWSEAREPRHIGYFCGQHGRSADPAPAGDAEARAEIDRSASACRAWLDSELAHLLPGACDAHGHLDPGRVVDGYVRSNVAPAERYQLSAPGTIHTRLPAHDTGFSNLTIAGDWVRTGLDIGCMEAAAMAGRQAARAIDGVARSIPGEPRSFGADVARRRVLPAFIERGFDLVAPPPYYARHCDMHAFFLQANGASLRALVDRLLNQPSGGKVQYVPAAPMVVLGAAFIRELRTAAPLGSIAEVDVAVWVPLYVRRGRRDKVLVWFQPWVFVDNAAATATGREVYGFAKVTCAMDHARDADGLEVLRVRGQAIVRHRPEARAEEVRFLEIRRHEGRLEERTKARATLARTLRVAQRGADGLIPWAIRGGGALSMVFLRQLRDVARPSQAAYQAIVEAPARLTRHEFTRWSAPRHDLTLSECDSLPMVRELGLESPRPRPLAVAHSRFDFVMEPGCEVWRA